jgi:poly(3-hydroxybutyrate) depolymerase
MKKYMCLLLVTMALFMAVSCGRSTETVEKQDTTDSVTTTDMAITTDLTVTTEATTESPTAPSVIFAEARQSDYVVVCDTQDATVMRLVNSFVRTVQGELGVVWPIKDASEGPFEHEVIIGTVRDSAAPVAATLEERSDFAISLVEDDLVICASDSRYYTYAFAYIEHEWLDHVKNKTLSLSTDDNFHRAESELGDVPFFTYWQKHNMKIGSSSLKLFLEQTDVVLQDGTIMKSYVYIPYEYDPAKAYPVLIHLHGADTVGDDGEHLGSISGAFSHRDSLLRDAIVIVPQCPADKKWVDVSWIVGSYNTNVVRESLALKGVMAILSEVEETYHTDKTRYYVRGYSMGGYGSWDLLARYPDTFAAAFPICGGADPTKAPYMTDVAIRTFHGELDSIVSVSGTRAMVAAIQAAGGTKIEYTEYPGTDHGIWTDLLDSKEHLAWLFSQQRTGNE